MKKIITGALVIFLVVFVPMAFFHLGKQKITFVSLNEPSDLGTNLEEQAKGYFDDFDWYANGDPITIAIFKKEAKMVIYKYNKGNWSDIKNIKYYDKTYEIGPKLSDKDERIPEGIYQIKELRKLKNGKLQIALDFPNSFDLEKIPAEQHAKLIPTPGSTAVPSITDDAGIKSSFITESELTQMLSYLILKNGTANCEVVISPFDLREGYEDYEFEEIDWEKELFTEIERKLLELNN